MTILNKEKILEQARALEKAGKYDRAIREYEKILLADPGDLRVKLRAAELHTKCKQMNEAIRIYREVAEAYDAEGFFLKAVTVYKNVLRLNPSLHEINEQLAILYEKMGLVADAVRQYDILASSLDQRGLTDRSLEIRERIVKLGPDDGAQLVKLAETYQREGRVEEAIDLYEKFVRKLEESGGDQKKLADLYEKILAHRRDRHEMFRKLIDIYGATANHKDALRWLEGMKDLVERDEELLKIMARIYISQNQNETARTRFVILADLCTEKGDIDGALEAYCEILTILPDEEDRLSRRVEEIRPGAFPEIVARAAKRREEIAKEEERRQEMEEAAERGKQAGEAAAKAKPPAPKAVPPRAAVGKKAPSAPPPAPRAQAPVPLVPKASPPKRVDADAAFNLGFVYLKMGMADEARPDLEKARRIYAACLDAGSADADIPGKLNQIDAALSGEPVRGPEPVISDQGPEKSDRKTKSREQGPDREKKPEEKKKKVSFV